MKSEPWPPMTLGGVGAAGIRANPRSTSFPHNEGCDVDGAAKMSGIPGAVRTGGGDRYSEANSESAAASGSQGCRHKEKTLSRCPDSVDPETGTRKTNLARPDHARPLGS